MIDDICSYGGTFFFSADKLNKLGFKNIDAYCTHSENVVNNPDSKIQLAFRSGLIKNLYTTDTLLRNTESKNIIIYHV
jgi:ribose-phosphate pyrophosphokinase